MKLIGRLQCLCSAIRADLSQRAHQVGRFSPLAIAAAMAASGGINQAEAVTAYVVNTAGDPGPAGTLSLREAVAAADALGGSDPTEIAVQFDPTLVGSTITLQNGEIAIDHAMTIAGPGSGLVVSGGDVSRIFHLTNANVYIDGLTLTNGYSDSIGGAVRADYGDLHLSNLVIRASNARYGGGVGVFEGALEMESSRVIDNVATENGGGIDAHGGDNIQLTHTTVSGNLAGHYGGGLNASDGADVSLSRCTVSNNTAAFGGSPYGGGGVSLQDVFSADIFTSTIAQNFATEGGGGVGASGPNTFIIRLTFATLSENATQDGSGNGIFVEDNQGVLQMSVVANNFSQGGNDDLVGNFYSYYSLIRNPGAAVVSGNKNLIGDMWDPMLGPLVDNGGATFTMLPAEGSPVLDVDLSGADVYDQRDLPRQTPISPHWDLGAVERQYPEDLAFRNDFDPW